MSNGSLLVRSARLEDHGYYLCQVDNGFGPGLSEPVLLTVHGKLWVTNPCYFFCWLDVLNNIHIHNNSH